MTGILNRYLEEEANLVDEHGTTYKVPHFLLNDIARFWRTMAVDFASKQRDRGGKGWGLRNAKLRMSRKLIFAAGLLVCFACSAEVDPKDCGASADYHRAVLVDFLKNYVGVTPLDIVADAAKRYGVKTQYVLGIFDAYDEFLGMLDDETKRNRLDSLRTEESRSDPDFGKIRIISGEFQDGLDQLFNRSDDKLAQLTKKYGIF